MKLSQLEPQSADDHANAELFQRELTADEMALVSGGIVSSARAAGTVSSARVLGTPGSARRL